MGYNYYLGVDSSSKLKGGNLKPSVFQGLEIKTKSETNKNIAKSQALIWS